MAERMDKRNLQAALLSKKAVETASDPVAPEAGVRGGTRERSVDRLVALLAHLHRVGHPVRVGELARALSAPRSTTYALVKVLTEAGLLETAGPTGEVFFGKTAYFYGMDYLRGHDLFARARTEVDRLARDTGETTQFCVMHERQYTVAYMSSGARPFRISSEIGTQIPLPWTASGRLLVADLKDSEIRALVTSADLRPPRSAPVTLDSFVEAVDKARQDGFCVTSGLVDPFTQCIAAPVRDRLDRVAATLCFVVLVDTAPERIDMLRDTLIASAQALSLTAAAR